MGQYDPPADYGIPNPLGPRTHNWKGGELNEGSLYHGPVYTRPMYTLPWKMRPMSGLGQAKTVEQQLVAALPWVIVGGLAVWLVATSEKK